MLSIEVLFSTLFNERRGFMEHLNTEVLVIGSGVAGLMTAELLSSQKNVTIITKSTLGQSNSILAQGGIAAVTTDDDSWTNHFFDTVQAGCFHNNEELTELLVRSGSKRIQQLIRMGVNFDRGQDGRYLKCREGAHSASRILHSGGDATGKEIVNTLIDRVRNRCTILEHHIAIDLLVDEGTCRGAVVMNSEGNNMAIKASHTILATGGAGQLYPVTSNDTSVTGDGIAIAYRAGATLSDLEFMQFHPTMFAGQTNQSFLVSEAVRGEGAILLTAEGRRLMEGKHDQLELAPRDVVAREIHMEQSPVYLDISSISQFEERFPTIAERCQQHGVILNEGKIPVKPGAHFLMGGVMTDRYGRTSIDGLFALGEVANTGVHGANRLASNSLLEGIVFANQSATYILRDSYKDLSQYEYEREVTVPKNLLETDRLKEVMHTQLGITRNGPGIQAAIQELDYTESEHEQSPTMADVIRFNMQQTSWLMATSAWMRRESRGSHYRLDYPYPKQEFKQKRITRGIYKDEWIKTQKRSRAVFY